MTHNFFHPHWMDGGGGREEETVLPCPYSLRATLQVLDALGTFKTNAGNQKRHMTGTGFC